MRRKSHKLVSPAPVSENAFKNKSRKPASPGMNSAKKINLPKSFTPRAALITPTDSSRFPIIGVGASAGGLEAFSLLLKSLPNDTGMAFVIIQHLDPEHESALTKLLTRTTTMVVAEVTEGTVVAPNCVYVIPPNSCMEISNGVLKLTPRDRAPSPHRSVDHFFESLALDQQERAIGIVLSGNASDGSQGLEMIKSEGGITFAQDDSAKYDSMPRSAVAAGCVDFVMSPPDIAKELVRIAKHPYVAASALDFNSRRESILRGKTNSLLSSGVRKSGSARADHESKDDDATPGDAGFKSILLLLRHHSGVDFSLYKSSTIQRRIHRRMVLNKQIKTTDYASLLQGNKAELDALYSDVLICVTSFFRNPDAFKALKLKVFPKILQQRQNDSPVRVWVLGCSTGQEAYSIAMAFTEFCDDIPRAPKLQIFATDLNDHTLDKARAGLYPKSLVSDISPARLARFFVDELGGYRISKPLRDLCVFARQNLLSDPPFSRMDLISCRNLLIYIDSGLQKKIIPNFHYALKPGGFLFLGAAESVGSFGSLFEAVDKKQKIFSRKPGASTTYHLPVAASRHTSGKKSVLKEEKESESFPSEFTAHREADRLLVNQFAPPSLLIDENFEVIHFRGATSLFLEPATGKASLNILKMARMDLVLPLRAAINKAKKENKTITRKNLHFDDEGGGRLVNVQVIPLKNLAKRFYLVLFEEIFKPSDASRLIAESASPRTSRRPGLVRLENRRIAELVRELDEARDYSQSLQEQHDAAHEELQASAEEAQSSNEEFQSTNEELETSKEELESTNEELITLNEEVAFRNGELSRLNSDLVNLQNSTRLPIVLLDKELSIRRFSPEAETVFNLMAADVGRPFHNIRHNLELPSLESMIKGVISTSRERECEVSDRKGNWYFLHVRPYIALDNKVDGAVLVLLNINPIKESEKAVVSARDLAEAIIRTARDPFLILDSRLCVERGNEAFYTIFRISPSDAIGRSVFRLDNGQWDIPRLRELLQDILPRHSFFNNFEVTASFRDIGERTMLLNARTLSESNGQPTRILLGIQDISELLHYQAQMRQSELRFRRLFETSRDPILIIDPATRKIIDANPLLTDLLRSPYEALLGRQFHEVGLLSNEASTLLAFKELQQSGFVRYENLPLQTCDGQKRIVELICHLYQEGSDKVVQCNLRDVTERKTHERQLSEKARLLDLTNDAIIVLDFSGVIQYWNHGAKNLYGWSSQEAVGQICDRLLKTEFPVPFEEITTVLRREGHWTGELIHFKRDGSRITALARKSLDRDAAGNPASVLQNLTDITQRKADAEAVRQSEASYRHLFNSIDEGFCVIEMIHDEKGKPCDYHVLEVNPSFVKQSGIEMVGKRVREVAPDFEQFWFDTFNNVLVTGIPTRFVHEANAFNRWFDVYAFRIGDLGDKRLAILFRDVTERTEAQQELRASQSLLLTHADELERLVRIRTSELTITNKQLEAFVYSIAHDLRAPLRSMQSYASMLLEKEGKRLSDEGRDYASRISKSARFLDSLLTDLLVFSVVAQQQVELTTLNLEKIVDSTIVRLEKEIRLRDAIVEVAGPWPDILGHESTLGQVLYNLASNALKFSLPDVRPILKIWAEDTSDFTRVYVQDNGIGIAPGHQKQIFGLFTRLHGEKYIGTGIGLAIVEKGVERLNGKVGLESAPGVGSRFWFDLPKPPPDSSSS